MPTNSDRAASGTDPTPGTPKSSALHTVLAIGGTPPAWAPQPRAGNDLVRVTEDDSLATHDRPRRNAN